MWQSTFDAISEPVTIVGNDFTIRRANLAAASLAHRDIKKLIGAPCYKTLARRQSPCNTCPMVECLTSHRTEESRIYRFNKNKDFHVQAYPFLAGDMVMHYRDITEETRMQQKLSRAERLATLGLLAGNVAHEINNPLGGILAFAQLAERDLPEDHPARDDLLEIQNAAKRCKTIVEDLLNLSRQPQEKEKAPLDVNQAIAATLPLVRVRLKEGRVNVIADLAPALPPIRGNADQIQQVVINLLTNAMHAMPQGGGQVRLATRPAPGNKGIEILVEDDGCGIAPDNLSKIFDPFFTTKRRGTGVGLGLAISRNLVWEHGGRIEVRSEVGKGSTFKVRLPALQKEDAKQRADHG